MAATSLDAERHLSAEGLRDLLNVVNSSRGLDEILGYLVVQAHQVLDSDGVGLYLRDPNDPAWLRMQAAHGVRNDLLNAEAPVGFPVIGLAVSKRRSVVVSDMAAGIRRRVVETVDEQLEDRGTYLEVLRPGPQSRDPEQREHNHRIAAVYRTLAAVPLVARDEAYGSLVLYYHAPNAYGAEQVDLSLAFAQQAALAIENARLRSQAEQRLREIERRQRVAEALRDLLAVVNSNHDLDEILTEILGQSSRLLGNDASVVYLRHNEHDDILRVRAALGLERDNLATEVRVGSPTTGLAVQQGRTLVCYDLTAALAYDVTRAADTHVEELEGYGRIVRMGARTDPDLETGTEPRVRRLVDRFRAVACTPLVARGRAFGAITLFYAEPRTFSAEEVDLARAFAEQATLAIENARLHTEAGHRMRENERRRRVAEGMRDLLASVNSTRSLDEILDLVLAQATDLLGSDAGSVLLLDGREGRQGLLTVRASRALVSDIVPARLPVGTAITGLAVERGTAAVVSDLLEAVPVADEPEPLLEQRPGFVKVLRIGAPPPELFDVLGLPRIRDIARYYRALLAVPLNVRGRRQGAITLYYRRPREFSREDISLAEAFADQTALAMENAQLYAQAVRRARDLEALYRADEVLYRSLRLDQVLQALVDVAADVLEADMTSVLVWDERHEHLVPGATRGFRPEVVAQMSHAPGEGITTRVALSGEPIAVEDAANDPRVAHRITDAEGIQSLLHVPIKVNGEVFGVFGVNYRQQRSLAGEEERVLLALAHRAAVAIENARLYTESEERLHELEALYRADETLHRSLRLDDVLRALAEVARDVLRADKSSVYMWDPERQQLLTAASHGYSEETTSQPLIPGEDLKLDLVDSSPLVIVDAETDPRLGAPRVREIIRREGIRSALGAPISVTGQAFGLFGVAYCEPHAPSVDEQRLVQAIAQRAALAIQNARLFEQAQQVATAEERQRLARELHDAVTQTLFSASLIAEVVPRLWERDPNEGRLRLEELRRLTRGALAEMRTLLLELRPAALVETPFVQLLRQLAEATVSRTDLLVEVLAEDVEQSLPPEVQIALYRIAQEALNNTMKHAGASHAEIHVRRRNGRVDLHLTDDGHGFEPTSTPAGHLGLRIMHERAHAIGARLRIASQPGAGTHIHVHWRGVAA
jgi:GAF domain-containing protein